MSTPRVNLKLQPVPKSIVRVTIVGEFLKNMDLFDDDTIRNVQQAQSEGLVEKLIIDGQDAANIARIRFTLAFAPLDQDVMLHLDLGDGKSTTEALDVGLAGALAYSVEIIKRRRLRPHLYVTWSAKALANPHNLQAACARLNFVTSNLPAYQPDMPTPPHYDMPPSTTTTPARPLTLGPPPRTPFKPLLTIQPAKDPGITYTIETAVRG